MKMSTFTKSVHRTVHWLLYLVAAILVFCAIVFTATRAMTPFLTLHKKKFESWVTKAIGLPVKVGKVSFGWRGIEPEMWLKNPIIYTQDGKKPIIQLKSLYVSLDLFRSFFTRHVSLGVITFAGANLDVQHIKDGYVLNKAITIHLQPSQSTSLSDYLQHLLRRSFISVKNINVRYETLDNKYYALHVNHLSLDGGDDDYQLYGGFLLKQKNSQPGSLSILAESHGNLFDFKHTDNEVYARVHNIRLLDWLPKKQIKGYFLHSGVLNGKLWFSVNKAKLRKVSAIPQIYNLSLHSVLTGQWVRLKSVSGIFAFKQNEHSFSLSVKKLNVASRHAVWPVINGYYSQDENNQVKTAWLNYLNIADVSHWLRNSSLLSARYRHLLAQYHATGALKNILVSLVGDKPSVYAQAQLVHVDAFGLPKVKAVKNISGSFVMLPDSGTFNLNSQNVSLDFAGLFPKPLQIESIQSRLHWRYDQVNGLHIYTQKMLLSNKDLTLYGSAAFDLSACKNAQPQLGLLAGFYLTTPTVAGKYLPVGIMKKGAVDWLDQAFISGGPMQGKLIIHGPLKHFPLLDDSGIFQVDTSVNNIDLHYADEWPDVTALNGELTFTDNLMRLNATSAKIAGQRVQHLQALIPSLAGKVPDKLYVDSVMSGNASQIFRFFEKGPLKSSVGRAVKNMKMTGYTKTHLKLNIPLSAPHNATLSGTTSLSKVKLYLSKWMLKLEKLTGDINFTRETLSANNLHASLLGYPATISIATQQKPVQTTVVDLQSQANLKQLFKYFKVKQPKFITGNFNYQAQLRLPYSFSPSAMNTLTLATNLKGTAINLPTPFYKASNTVLPLQFKTRFSGKKPGNINFSLGSRIAGALSFVPYKNAVKFYSAQLNFGSSKAVAPVRRSLLITGYLPSFDWQSWKPVVAYLKTYYGVSKKQGQAQTKGQLLEQYKPQLDLHVADLRFNQHWHLQNVHLKMRRLLRAWSIYLNNKLLGGTVVYPDNYPHSQISADVTHLNLSALKKIMKSNGEKSAINLSKVPWIHARFHHVLYNKLDISSGEVILKPHEKRLDLERLVLASPFLSCHLSGASRYTPDGRLISSVRGQLSSNSVQQLLKTLGVTSSVLAKYFVTNVDFSWPGFFDAIKPTIITGSASVLIKNGWVVDLGKSTTQKLNLGKLVTLLSVQHLLTLHASDLGKNGYHFDKLTAYLLFHHGVISSNNLNALGTVADIKAKGHINLINKTLDLWLGVDTNLGASLPAIATIAGGPVIGPIAGFATWVVDKIVHTASRKYSGYGYHIVGHWSHPRVLKSSEHQHK